MEAGIMKPGTDDKGKQKAVADNEEYDVAGREKEEMMVEEVMKGLEEEINGQDIPFPYSTCAFVTINGNEESCGPSFSDSSSTVMASIDVGAVGIWGQSAQATEPVWGVVEDCLWPDGETELMGESEEWLARLLSEPAFEFPGDFDFERGRVRSDVGSV